MAKKSDLGGAALQFPLFTTHSDWMPPNLNDLPCWSEAKRVGIDSETRDPALRTLGPGVRRNDSYVVGYSFAIEGGPCAYVPLRHLGGDNIDNPDLGWQYLKKQASVFTGEIVGQNLSYDLDFLAQNGVIFRRASSFRDIMIAEALIYELHNSYSLKATAERRGLPPKQEQKLLEAAANFGVDPKGGLWKLPARYVGLYAEQDARLPLQILRLQEKDIEAQGLQRIWDIESDLVPVLVKMRRRGVAIDWDKLGRIEDWTREEEQKALDQVHFDTGVRIAFGDVWKAKALAPALAQLGINVGKTEKTAQPQIDKALLGSSDHPSMRALAWARKVNKLRTTFAQSIHNHATNGRIHTTFNQIFGEREEGGTRGAKFGRMSCENPNLQQQPSRDEFAATWRSIYLPEPGMQWACCDFCFSDDTEVLTEHGFRFFRDLDRTERLAQWHAGEITFAMPLDYQVVPFRGDMVHVYGERATDLLMSPNHDCLLQKHGGQFFRIRAEEYNNVAAYQIASGLFHAYHTTDRAILRLVVALQADGAERSEHYRVFLKKPRKIERMQQLLKESGLPYGEGFLENKAAGHYFTIPYDERLSAFLKPGKLFDRIALLKLTVELRNDFLDELELWDGSAHGNYYCSTNVENVEIVQEIAVLSGRRANLTFPKIKSGRPYAAVTLSRRTRTWARKFKTDRVPYDGIIYCVTMPQGTVTVRRNGKVSVTGQSQQEPRWVAHFANALRLPGAAEMVRRYNEDPATDSHQMMADITGLPRKEAKIIYLGVMYGEGGYKLCIDLGYPTAVKITVQRGKWVDEGTEEGDAALAAGGRRVLAAGAQGQAILDKFNTEAPFVKGLSDACASVAKSRGFIKTILGRRCRFPKDDQGNWDWTYRALNRLIQGSAGDQVKAAMVEVDRAGHYLQLQVHDELDGSVEDRAEGEAMAEIMKNVVTMSVPFKVDVEIGKSWGEIE